MGSCLVCSALVGSYLICSALVVSGLKKCFTYIYKYIFSCVVLRILHCPLSRPDLIYISLWIICCIIEYVTNKRTLNLKRIGDLQALSFAPSCLEFAPGMVKAFLHPRPGYVSKVPANVTRSIMLQAFCPPFQNSDQERHNLLCPVRH